MPDSDIHYIGLEPRPNLPRRTLPYTVIATFMVVMLWMGVSNDFSLNPDLVTIDSSLPAEAAAADSPVDEFKHKGWPDFSKYYDVRTIYNDELNMDIPDRRVIIVGDIHGMEEPFDDLLLKVKYTPKSDLLIHLGDILVKGPHSLRVLSRMSAQNVTGIRGNHDQKVIEWRGFIEWLEDRKGGKKWLEEMDELHLTPKEFKKLPKHKKKFDIPAGWEWGGEHFKIARKMPETDYKYLLQLPTVLHIPYFHAHLVHAGLLPADPKRPLHNHRQPLSHLPKSFPSAKGDVDLIRSEQELSILTDVPQNTKGWAKLNMRDILRNGEVTRRAGVGRPWSDMWNEVQKMCHGFDGKRAEDENEDEEEESEDVDEGGNYLGGELDEVKRPKKSLPCHPTAVIYGHAAGRGLDIKRWSHGLDTGCVYGRKLTALVLRSPKSKVFDEFDGDDEAEELQFGDKSKGRLVSVKCKEP